MIREMIDLGAPIRCVPMERGRKGIDTLNHQNVLAYFKGRSSANRFENGPLATY